MSFQKHIDKLSCITSIQLRGDVNACNFNSFYTLAVGTSDKTVSVWFYTEEGFKEATYSPIVVHEYPLVSIAFSNDGKLLTTSSSDGRTYLFNTLTGRVVNSLVQTIGGGVRQSAISQRFLGTVSDDGYIFLWNLDSCQKLRFWLGHEACTHCLAFSPGSFLLATGDSDGTFKLWFVDNAISSIHTVDTLIGHLQKDAQDGAILSLTFSPNHYTDLLTGDYQMCSGGYDELIHLWHISVTHNDKTPIKVEPVGTFQGHSSSVTCVRYSSDGKYIGSTSIDSTARIWQCDTATCVQVITKHMHSALCCAFSTEFAFFATGSSDKTVNIWKLSSSEVPVITPETPSLDEEVEESDRIEQTQFNVLTTLHLDCHVNSVAFNMANELVVGCSDKTVRVFYKDGPDFVPICGIAEDCHTYPVVQVEFSKCGNYLVTGSLDGTIIVWNYKKTRAMVQEPYVVSFQGGRAVRFCPSTNCLGLGTNDGTVHLKSIETSFFFTYAGHNEAVKCVAFTPDGQYLVTGCMAGHLNIWLTNPPRAQSLLTLEDVHDMGVMTCDFSKQSSSIPENGLIGGYQKREYLLATGGQDSLVKVFKVLRLSETEIQIKECFCFKDHGSTVCEVRFSNRSANILASASSDRTVRIWNMQTGQCLNTISVHKNQVTCLAFSPDFSLLASGSLDSTVVISKVPELMQHHFRSESHVKPASKRMTDDPIDLEELSLNDKNISICDLIAAFKSTSGDIPEHMICPITQDIFVDPVICEDGFTYEREAIQSWMTNGRITSPMTNVSLTSTITSPNHLLKEEIKQFLLLNYKK